MLTDIDRKDISDDFIYFLDRCRFDIESKGYLRTIDLISKWYQLFPSQTYGGFQCDYDEIEKTFKLLYLKPLYSSLSDLIQYNNDLESIDFVNKTYSNIIYELNGKNKEVNIKPIFDFSSLDNFKFN